MDGFVISVACFRCGQQMSLDLPDGIDREDAERLSRLVCCDACSPLRKRKAKPIAVPQTISQGPARLPYKDDQ